MNEKSPLSDSELVEAIGETNKLELAISQLYRDHASIARAFIMGKGGTAADADDIFQETIVSFIDTVQRRRFRQESSIRTFLISISKNLWYNEIRRRQRAGNRDKNYEMDREEADHGIQEVIGDRELKYLLNQMLKELGDSCKKILELFYFENLPVKEMVSHLHYENEQVVRNKKYKCLQQLTEKMKQSPRVAEQIRELIKK